MAAGCSNRRASQIAWSHSIASTSDAAAAAAAAWLPDALFQAIVTLMWSVRRDRSQAVFNTTDRPTDCYMASDHPLGHTQ